MNKHNAEMEQALLGIFLVDGGAVRTVDIDASDFWVKRHQWIYQAMKSVGTVDYLTVRDELERTNKDVDSSYLMKLSATYMTSIMADEYADKIKGYARDRNYLRILGTAANDINNGGLDVPKLLSDLTGNIGINGEAVHISEPASELFDIIQDRQNDPREIWGMETGFADFDKLTGGLHKKQTTIFAGEPSVGKTLLVMQMAYQLAKKGYSVGIWSFEMNATRLLSRLVAAETGVGTRKMYQGKLNGDLGKVMEAIGELEKLPIYISDVSGMTTSALRADVSRLKALHKIDVGVLDYLNKLLDSDGSSTNDNTANKSRRWQAICKDFDIHGLTVQSVNKEGMRESVPGMAGVSGPTAVTHEADSVFFMKKNPTHTKHEVIDLQASKLRDGDMGKKVISLVKLPGLPKFGDYSPVYTDVSNI